MFEFGHKFYIGTVTFLVLQIFITGGTEINNCMCSEWEEWTEFGACSAHCGGGIKSRNRSRICMDNVFNTDSGTNCKKKSTQYQVCNTQECGCEEMCSPWSDWVNGNCSLHCGGGILYTERTRQCHGSIGCSSKEEAKQSCNEEPCEGCSCNDWSAWSEYGSCSSLCGPGEQHRNRTRDCKPHPKCLGASVEHSSTYCNLGVCCDDACTPWSEWKDVQCSVTCDYGTTKKSRIRLCSLETCNDSEEKNGLCKVLTCKDTCDSTCTQWQPWTWYPCSKSCGGGNRIRQRTRTCTFPDCLEDDIHMAPCNAFRCMECNEDEDCSEWSDWTNGACSVTCDKGTQFKTRTRDCSIPECKTTDTYNDVCKVSTCEATCDSTCTAWSSWEDSECSQTCDNGVVLHHRNRSCFHGDCALHTEKYVSCNLKPCPETCNQFCSQWSGWKSSECPVTCGGGKLVWKRLRMCDHPDCPQAETTTSLCNPQECGSSCDNVCEAWSEWVDQTCSATCGEGTNRRHRIRTCPPDFLCKNDEMLTVPCLSKECPDKINDVQTTTLTTVSCKQGLIHYLPHPTDCERFIQCANGQSYTMKCPAPTGWNPMLNACDHKKNIPYCY